MVSSYVIVRAGPPAWLLAWLLLVGLKSSALSNISEGAYCPLENVVALRCQLLGQPGSLMKSRVKQAQR